ncbi:MAG: hypothetical protein WCF36_08460 [Candidatus Nanopelagicales bacterium]
MRTLITAMAGVGRMDVPTCALHSAIGGALWATGVTLLGYFLGNIAVVKDNIELIRIGIVGSSVVPVPVPVAIETLRHRWRTRSGSLSA